MQTSHNRSPNQHTPWMTKKQGENPPLKGKQQVTEKSCLHYKSCKMAKICHSESVWTTSVGKYWKSCKMAKICHSEPIETSLVEKYWKSCKTVNSDHFGRKTLEKLQNSQNWPF